MTAIYKRILIKKAPTGLTWNELAEAAGIPVATWMTGLPSSEPTDEELQKMAAALDTTYEYLKYGRE